MLSAKRQKFIHLEKVIGRKLSFISANAWTAASIIFGLVAAYFIAMNAFLLGALLFALAALCDAVDGAVARFRKSVTKRGAYLDTIVDRYVEFFLIAGLFFASLPVFVINAKLWLLVYLFGAMMTTYAKAAAKEKGLVKEEMRFGLMERAERLALLFVGLLLASVNKFYLVYIIVILAVLANITALQRISKALQEK